MKELEALAKQLGKDFQVIKYIDNWTFDYTGKMGMTRKETVREFLTISMIYDEFVNKSGEFYETHKSTGQFRDFKKLVSSQYYEPKCIYKFYEDSYETFNKEWNKIHPEITYEKFEDAQRKKYGRYWQTMMEDVYLDLYRDIYAIKNIYA